ncbi:MAG: hypothetical protein ABFD49_08895 [Armatimonadota bacterium]|nr:hypothetical protein [bacterium]
MDKRHVAARIYGYMICLITLLTVVFSIQGIVEAVFNLTDAEQVAHSKECDSYSYRGYNMASYEAFKLDVIVAMANGQQKNQNKVSLDENMLKKAYQDALTTEIHSIRRQSEKDLTGYCILIFVSLVLFVFHWKWLRRLADSNI